MNFGQAIDHLKAGSKVARQGWNGKDMWLSLVTNWSGNVSNTGLPTEMLWSYSPFIVIKSPSHAFTPWVTSQADVLAEDWEIVECNH